MTKRVPRQHVSFELGIGNSLKDAVGDYPPILTPAQAAELLQKPLKTIHAWLAAGHLDKAARKRGRTWRIWRDALIKHYFNGANWT